MELLNGELARDPPRGPLIVAGHEDRLKPGLAQAGDSAMCIRPDRIAESDLPAARKCRRLTANRIGTAGRLVRTLRCHGSIAADLYLDWGDLRISVIMTAFLSLATSNCTKSPGRKSFNMRRFVTWNGISIARILMLPSALSISSVWMVTEGAAPEPMSMARI
jgi:hypothetical protein